MAEEFDVDLRSGRVHAERFGDFDAPPVLAVHGLSANIRAFDHLMPPLAAAGGHQVVLADLRGRGRSQCTAPGSYGLESHARDLLELATLLGHDTFDWVGWSLGALIGIVAAGLEPGRIRRLCLIDHTGSRPDPSAVAVVIDGLDRLDLDASSSAEYVARVEETSRLRPFTDFWRRFYAYEFGRTNKSACLEDARDVSHHDWPRLWRQLNMPVLLLRCRQPLNGGLIVADDVAGDLAAAVPTLSVIDVDADHFTVMTHQPAAEAIRAQLV